MKTFFSNMTRKFGKVIATAALAGTFLAVAPVAANAQPRVFFRGGVVVRPAPVVVAPAYGYYGYGYGYPVVHDRFFYGHRFYGRPAYGRRW